MFKNAKSISQQRMTDGVLPRSTEMKRWSKEAQVKLNFNRPCANQCTSKDYCSSEPIVSTPSSDQARCALFIRPLNPVFWDSTRALISVITGVGKLLCALLQGAIQRSLNGESKGYDRGYDYRS